MKSDLIFRSVDQNQVRFEIASPGVMRANRILTFDRSVLPADFDATMHNASGTLSITIKVEDKPKEK